MGPLDRTNIPELHRKPVLALALVFHRVGEDIGGPYPNDNESRLKRKRINFK